MKKPILVERFSDNGEHSHWDLIDSETQETIWTGDQELKGNPKKVIIDAIQYENGSVSHALYSGYTAFETIALLQLSLQRLTNQCLEASNDNEKNNKNH